MCVFTQKLLCLYMCCVHVHIYLRNRTERGRESANLDIGVLISSFIVNACKCKHLHSKIAYTQYLHVKNYMTEYNRM